MTNIVGRAGSSVATVSRPPNRLTAAFTEMKSTCPTEMTAYAACVLAAHSGGGLHRHVCEEEFRLVRECFRKVTGRHDNK
mmetsp:Transcript_8677/g.19072  ORF Transcript_8677/g.19072 Transcript_8677/m.19072 type:complete len:80 (+) Transcript_8677:142-381(+)